MSINIRCERCGNDIPWTSAFGDMHENCPKCEHKRISVNRHDGKVITWCKDCNQTLSVK